MTSRPFRFGVIAKKARSATEFRDFARRVEDLGYSTFYMPDHFVDHPLAPIPGIMAAAGATTSLRIGTLVLGNDYKHPVVLANEAATIDLLSDGRLELGVGAGWMTVDYEQGGFPLDSAGVRIAQLVIQRVEYVEFELVDTLDETTRDTFGFGSTGR